MAIESIGTVLESPQRQTQQSAIGQDDLFKIMLTQLSYQDPLEPLDNREFIAQLAQFTDLEQARESNEKIQALLTVQSADQSIGLIGKDVEVNNDAGTTIGKVISVTFNQGEPSLAVEQSNGDGFLTDVKLSQIRVIR